MNKLLILLLSLFLTTWAHAQSLGRTAADNSDFPHITIQFSHRDPVSLKEKEVILLHGGEKIEYELSENKDSLLYEGQITFILFENSHWKRFEKQRDLGKQLFETALKDKPDKQHELYLATFDWTIDKQTNFTLLHGEPIQNYNEFVSVLKEIQKPASDGRLHESTEIFPALLDALDFVHHAQKNKNLAPAIILYSSEFSNIYNNKQTKFDAISKAREYNIPIYCIHYPHYHDKYNLQDLALKTYGERVSIAPLQPDVAISEVSKWLENIPLRASGKNYTLKFTSPSRADGKQQEVDIEVSGIENIRLTYHPPSALTFFFSKKKNVAIVGILGLLLLIAITYLFIRAKKKDAAEKKARKEELENIKRETEEALYLKEKELEEKERAKEAQLLKEKENELINKIRTHFHQLNRKPTLTTDDGYTFAIDNLQTQIGRATDNEICLEVSSVSRKHTCIGFGIYPGETEMAGKEFYIWDLNSANGTYVNGKKVPTESAVLNGQIPPVLKNNDHIQLGDKHLIFNL